MKGYSHAIIGTAASLAVSKIIGLEFDYITIGITVIAGLIPDIDTEHSTINARLPLHQGKLIYIIASLYLFYTAYTTKNIILAAPAALLLFIYISPHRGFTHSIFACCIMALYFLPNVARLIQFSISYMAHILCDMINTKGVQLLYPLKNRFKLPLNFAMDSVMGKTIELLAVVVSFAVIYQSYIGGI